MIANLPWNRVSRLGALGLLGIFASLPGHASLVFTCAANIDAAQAGTCNYLNTTVRGTYDSNFTDVSANVWIRYGTTGLGSSFTAFDSVTYANYRTALLADQQSNPDVIFENASVPLANPFGTDNMLLTHANETAVNLTPGTGGRCVVGVHAGCVTANIASDPTFGTCTITGANYGVSCFDSVITISSAQQTGGNLWYRGLSGGAQGNTQFDFFSVVYHESDEVLGTVSFCCGQQAGFFTPPDLARYSSNGSRSHGFGSNATGCDPATPSGTNACLTFDGGNTFVAQYNNLNNGNDAGDFSSSCTFVQDMAGCRGSSFNPAAGVELQLLDVIGYSQTPEPSALALMGAGLAALGSLRRRRR